jgi:uncharacterized MAPEG superfamily protein
VKILPLLFGLESSLYHFTKMTSPSHKPPSKAVILCIDLVLGTVASFLFGRKPTTLPDSLVAEICPSIIVVCAFLTSYSLWDVMGAGMAKAEVGLPDLDYKDSPSKLPESAYLAERAQMNQLEQMPSFLFGIMCFSILVNGMAGAVLGLVWVILRRLYASRYRNSVGKKFKDKDLGTFTVPCYIILDTMFMGSAIHACRWMIASLK